MYIARRWSTRNAWLLARVYKGFEALLVSLDPLFRKIGYQSLEGPFARIENLVKGFLFDSKMCGSCTLSSTGMTCPMNCPKKLRNGPCGGVRQNGFCEVDATMPCVWREAFTGSQRFAEGVQILEIQQPVDHRLQGSSSWLRAVRNKLGM